MGEKSKSSFQTAKAVWGSKEKAARESFSKLNGKERRTEGAWRLASTLTVQRCHLVMLLEEPQVPLARDKENDSLFASRHFL